MIQKYRIEKLISQTDRQNKHLYRLNRWCKGLDTAGFDKTLQKFLGLQTCFKNFGYQCNLQSQYNRIKIQLHLKFTYENRK